MKRNEKTPLHFTYKRRLYEYLCFQQKSNDGGRLKTTNATATAADFGRYIGAALLYVSFATYKVKTTNNARNGGHLAAFVGNK